MKMNINQGCLQNNLMYSATNNQAFINRFPKKEKALLLACLFFLCVFVAAGQSQHRAVLLRNIATLPQPTALPPNSYPIHIFSEAPEIIAATKNKAETEYQFNAIVAAPLEKGKILCFGSDYLFTKSFAAKTASRQLLRNILQWANVGKGQQVQVWGTSSDFTGLLQKEKISFASLTGKLNGNCKLLFLLEDVSNQLHRSSIENFISQGGVLVLISPLSAIHAKNINEYPELKVNALLAKAGILQTHYPVKTKNADSLLTQNFPDYLHFATQLEAIRSSRFLDWKRHSIWIDLLFSSLGSAIFYNAAGASQIEKIRAVLQLDSSSIIIPTATNPLRKTDLFNFVRLLVQAQLKALKRIGSSGPGQIEEAGKDFPGAVPPNAERVSETISVPVAVQKQGSWEPDQLFHRWHSTGLYVPAGQTVNITLSPELAARNIKVQVGVHNDDLWHLEEFTRDPVDLTTTLPLSQKTTQVIAPYGGLLLVTIPDTSTLESISLKVDSAVKYPYFRLGETSLAEWRNTIRNYPAPWAELASDKIILTIPASRIRQLDDPETLLRFWDEVMDADAKLAAVSTTRTHPERVIVDRQVAYGYMFTTDAKIVVPDDESCPEMLDVQHMRAKGSWGHLHELGHRHQFHPLDFEGLTEVSVNLFTMYVYDKVLHKGIYNHEQISSKEAVVEKIKKYMAAGPTYEQWAQDPFLALSMFIQIIEGFGWQPIEQTFQVFRSMPQKNYPATEEAKRDLWFATLCLATQKNLAPFFDKWKIPVSYEVKSKVKSFPEWLPAELK